MKMHIVTLILLLFGITLYAQDDCLKRLEERAVQIKELEEKVQLLESNEKRLQELLSQKKDNNANQVKFLRDSISAPYNSLKLRFDSAQIALKAKDDEIKKYSDNQRLESSKQYQEGQQNAASQLVSFYRKPFDNLANSLSLTSVERDKEFLNQLKFDDKRILPTIDNVLTYKKAESVLEKKFDLSMVNQAKTSLSNLSNEQSAVKLLDLLDKYQDRNEGLKETLQEIQKLNDLPAKGNEVISEEKWKDFWANINQYLFSYGVDLEEYPYIRKNIFELISIKQDNIDNDIQALINKL
jgi:hypothetical protein